MQNNIIGLVSFFRSCQLRSWCDAFGKKSKGISASIQLNKVKCGLQRRRERWQSGVYDTALCGYEALAETVNKSPRGKAVKSLSFIRQPPSSHTFYTLNHQDRKKREGHREKGRHSDRGMERRRDGAWPRFDGKREALRFLAYNTREKKSQNSLGEYFSHLALLISEMWLWEATSEPRAFNPYLQACIFYLADFLGCLIYLKGRWQAVECC